MDVTTTSPGSVRRVLGWIVMMAGTAIVVAICTYFALNVASLAEIAFVMLGVFGVAMGGTLLGFGLFLAAKSHVTRRIGCIGSVVLSVPTVLLLTFLVWSLFQTTKPALD